MRAICIDSSCFAIQLCEDSAHLEKFLHRLVQLHKLVDQARILIVISRTTYATLAEAGLYPIADFAPDRPFPQRRDVVALIHRLIDRAAALEDLFQVDEVLIDWSSCTLVPNDVLAGMPARLQEQVLRVVSLLALAARRQSSAAAPAVLLLDSASGEPINVVASGVIEDWEPRGNGLTDTAGSLPYRLEIVMCESVPAAIGMLSPADIWISHDRYDVAIALAVHKHVVNNGAVTWPIQVPPFAIRDEFVESMRAHGFASDHALAESLLRACVQIITGATPTKCHPLRKSKGGNAPDRRRAADNAAAMRHDVNYEYHVHYWATANGPELTVLATHNDYYLPE